MRSRQRYEKSEHPLEIHKVEVEDGEYLSEVPPRMRNKHFPGFPSSSVFIGMPGSGKSNCLMHMLLSPLFWRGFFDEIHLFGPTVKSDKLYGLIKVPEENICTDADELIPKLKEFQKKQQTAVEGDKKEAFKILCIFEDLTSFFNKIQNKPEFIKAYTQYRHLKGSSVSMVHKYKAFNRTCRMSSRHLLCWEMNKTDKKQLYEDFGPPSMNEKQWMEMMNYALTKRHEDDHPFFYINTHAPPHLRFRRCFTEVLELPTALPAHLSLAPTQRKRRERSRSPEERKRERSR